MTMQVAFESGPSSYPGGKSGAGIYQRLINLIPPHRVLVVAFAGHCGIVRNIRPAEHTIVIDRDPEVCSWWASWRRSKHGRDLEIHNCDGIEWLRHNFGFTEYSAPSGTREPTDSAAEYFWFLDPPYVLSERTGKLYNFELEDADHLRLLGILTTNPAARYQIMLCGYNCELYNELNSLPGWESIDHRVPTRRGLQDERIWMNYERPTILHDYQHIGDSRRSRERIRRRQRNWLAQLNAMSPIERRAMIEALNGGQW